LQKMTIAGVNAQGGVGSTHTSYCKTLSKWRMRRN